MIVVIVVMHDNDDDLQGIAVVVRLNQMYIVNNAVDYVEEINVWVMLWNDDVILFVLFDYLLTYLLFLFFDHLNSRFVLSFCCDKPIGKDKRKKNLINRLVLKNKFSF